MIPVILSGGSGTRLWPVSRSKVPKQFSDLFDTSLQTMAIRRAFELGSPWILTTQDLKDHTEKHLMNLRTSSTDPLDKVKIIYEPQAKNTAAAIAYLCWTMTQNHLENEVLAVFPSDHLIENENQFIQSLRLAESEAKNDFIVTLGIKPHFASTGYGYIEVESFNSVSTQHVKKFYEKPDLKTAESFLKSGNFYWNAGMFVFKPVVLNQLFQKYSPEFISAFKLLKPDLSNLDSVYAKLEKVSIDYALMEKLESKELKCIPCNMGWSDVGSWDSVAEIFSPRNETSSLKKNQIEILSKNNYLHSKLKKVYALAGVSDLIVVDTPDALLIAKKGETQLVKNIVDQLKELQDRSADYPLNEERPWGNFEVLKDMNDYKAKVIQVEPGCQLSYQSHHQREEHWLIVAGHGEVILNNETIQIKKGQYIKIPLQAKHRIRNTGQNILEFVEVQLGTYFGEDDIIRYT